MLTIEAIDDVRHKLSDGEYLRIMNAFRDDFKTMSKRVDAAENTIIELRNNTQTNQTILENIDNRRVSCVHNGRIMMGTVYVENSRPIVYWDDGSEEEKTVRSIKNLLSRHAKRFPNVRIISV